MESIETNQKLGIKVSSEATGVVKVYSIVQYNGEIVSGNMPCILYQHLTTRLTGGHQDLYRQFQGCIVCVCNQD